MENKIYEALEYYFIKRADILNYVNGKANLTAEEIIEKGEALSVLENKITGLQVALEN